MKRVAGQRSSERVQRGVEVGGLDVRGMGEGGSWGSADGSEGSGDGSGGRGWFKISIT